MTKDEIYEIWRPDASPWSPWVKPILFSFLSDEDLGTANDSARPWPVPLMLDTAIVVDLPGAEGVTAGVALAHEGYRPIPVYNASPYALYDPSPTNTHTVVSIIDVRPVAAFAVVDVLPIMSALCRGVNALTAAQVFPSAPPAFLLDSNRPGRQTFSDVGWFDNRSFIATTDFPSADIFKQHGIMKIVLVQTAAKIQPDLLQVLLAWQRDGMKIAKQEPWEPWALRSITVKNLPFMIRLWEGLRRTFGYRRNLYGSFGDVVRSSGG